MSTESTKKPFNLQNLPDIVMRGIYSHLDLEGITNLQQVAKSAMAKNGETNRLLEGFKSLDKQANHNLVWIPFAQRIGVPLKIVKTLGTEGLEEGQAKIKTLEHVKDLIQAAQSHPIKPQFIQEILERAKERKLTFDDAKMLHDYIPMRDSIVVRNAIAKRIPDTTPIDLNQDFAQLESAAAGFEQWLNEMQQNGSLGQLRALDLHNNQLRKLPNWLGTLGQLQWLYLHNNQLRELPNWLGTLSQLRVLDLNDNQLRELPNWAPGTLDQLQGLYLSGNQLSELPNWLGTLDQLQNLALTDNQLSELPNWALGTLSHLQGLYICDNQLSELPNWLGMLDQLENLALSNNQLSQLPNWLGTLNHLQNLDLEDNHLTELPEPLANHFREIGCEVSFLPQKQSD